MEKLYEIRKLNNTVDHCELLIRCEKAFDEPDKKLIRNLQARMRRAKKKLDEI